MSDPFEARMRFTGMLQGLNATTAAAHKAALYALKFKDYDEDFQSCILEQLGRVGCCPRFLISRDAATVSADSFQRVT